LLSVSSAWEFILFSGSNVTMANNTLQPTVKKLRFLPSAELAR
jgi:hypothetical protein